MSYAPVRRSIILSTEKAFYTVVEGSVGCGSKGIAAAALSSCLKQTPCHLVLL